MSRRTSVSFDDLAALREEFSAEFRAHRARTDTALAERDATIAILLATVEALQTARDSLPPDDDVEEYPPAGNWQSIGEVMFITDRKHSTVRKWIKEKKVRSHQPGGPRTAIKIDVDSLPSAWVRRSAKIPAGRTAG